MRAPTVTVRAEIYGQNGDPVVGANVVAALDRDDVYDGVIVPSRASARTDERGIAELSLFPNDIGATGSAYDIAAYDAAGRMIWQTRAVLPPSDEPLSLHAYASDRIKRPTGLTDQQIRDVRAARAGIDVIRAEVSDNAATAASAAQSAQTLRDETRALRDRAAEIGEQVAADRTAVDEQRTAIDAAATAAVDAARSANSSAQQTTRDREQTAADRKAATDAADSASALAARLDQLINENNALRRLVEHEHGRPLLRDGARY